MSTIPVLNDAETQAVDIAYAIYRNVSSSPALDGTDHWDRFANRIKSAATAAPTAMRFVEQCGRRFSVPHINGDAITVLLSTPPAEQAAVLRVLRHESTPVSTLVRARRDEERKARA